METGFAPINIPSALYLPFKGSRCIAFRCITITTLYMKNFHQLIDIILTFRAGKNREYQGKQNQCEFHLLKSVNLIHAKAQPGQSHKGAFLIINIDTVACVWAVFFVMDIRL